MRRVINNRTEELMFPDEFDKTKIYLVYQHEELYKLSRLNHDDFCITSITDTKRYWSAFGTKNAGNVCLEKMSCLFNEPVYEFDSLVEGLKFYGLIK